VVSAYGALQAPSDAEAVLAAATRAARAEGLEAVTHALRDSPAETLIAVAAEQDSGPLGFQEQLRAEAERPGAQLLLEPPLHLEGKASDQSSARGLLGADAMP
jgi:hypothetical protein